jgi:glycolate oxidase FAD binding subunit
MEWMPTEVSPASIDDLAREMRHAGESRQTVEIGGNFTKRAMGGPLVPAEVILSTRRLNRIVAYEPKDLTVSVEAGMRFRDFIAALRANGQMLPLDPPFTDDATIGGVVATNSSGPRRRRYGTARDMVIGMKMATLEGAIVSSGGMVVKNVTGLDMAKLLIGSFGTLAAIATVNFKVFPLPEAERTLVAASDSLSKLLDLRRSILRSALQPAAIDLLNPDAATYLPGDLPRSYLLVTECSGNGPSVDRYEREYGTLAQQSGVSLVALQDEIAGAVWESICNLTPCLAGEQGFVLRLSTTPARLEDLFRASVSTNGPLPVLARAGVAVAYAYCSTSEAARSILQRAQAAGIRGIVESSPLEKKQDLELWSNPGAEFALMQRIKNSLDPNNLLNPGRLWGRI